MRIITLPLLLIGATAMAQRPTAIPATMGIPMLSSEAMDAEKAPGQGKLIFNTSERGFYWFDGTTWQPLLSARFNADLSAMEWHVQRVGPSSAPGILKASNGTTGFWDLTGNSGTTNTTNFLGTTDAKSFFLRVNNLHAGRIQNTGELSASAVGGPLVVTQEPGVTSTAGGELIIQDDPGPGGTSVPPVGNDAGVGHTSFGSEAGRLDGGRHNSFFGRAAGYNVTAGSGNTALGALTMVNGGVSNRNTAVGALAHGTTGPTTECTSMGYQAGPQGALTNSTALGSKATVTSSNSLVLGSINGVNGATADVNVGIGVTAPAAKLHTFSAANATKNTFTQGIASAGLLLTSDFSNGSFTPGLFWSTRNNNAAKPKAGIFLQETNAGSTMFLATSNNYGTGITNDGLVIDPQGNVGVKTSAPLTSMDVNGGLSVRLASTQTLPVGANTITVGDRSYLRFTTSGSSALNLSNGLVTGQMLLIESGGGTITVADNAATSNCNLVANRSLGTNDVLTLIWNGLDWIEVAFTNN